MQFNINDVHVMAGILIFYAFMLMGIDKFHAVEYGRTLPGKEKRILVCLLLLLAAIVSIYIVRNTGIQVLESGNIGRQIEIFFDKLYYENDTMILFAKYSIAQLPALFIFVMALSRLIGLCGLEGTPVYYLMLFTVMNKEAYSIIGNTWEETILFFLATVALMGIVDCLEHDFTKKKIIFLLVLAFAFVGVEFVSGGVMLSGMRMSVVVFAEGILIGLIVKYGQYLRRVIRKFIKLVYITLVLYLNLNFF